MSQYNKPINGKIYSKSDGVTAIAADQIADYQDDAGVTIAAESISAYGQNFWPQAVALNTLALTFTYNGVYWATSIADTMLGVSATTGSLKDSTAATASIRKLTTSMTTIPTPEFLTQWTQSSTSKKRQIWAAAGQMESDLALALSKDDFITTTLGIGCFADANGDIVWFIDEP